MNRVAEKIIKDAEARCREIEEDQKKSEARLSAEYEKELQECSNEYRDLLRDMLDSEVKRLKAAEEMKGSKEVLREKIKIMDEAVSECAERIRADKNLYRLFLESMVLKGALSGKEEIILSSEDADELGREFIESMNRALKDKRGITGALTLSKERGIAGGGCVLRQGPVEFNGTVDEAVRTVAGRFRVEVGALLFGLAGEGKQEEKK